MPQESFISNLNQILGGSPWDNTVIVAKTGGDFSTVKEACDYVATQSPGSDNRWRLTIIFLKSTIGLSVISIGLVSINIGL